MGMEYFGNKLKTLRKSKELTQSELARQLNLSKGTVSSYEQGKMYPSVEVLIKMCQILGVSSDYLLGMEDELPIQMSGLTEKQMKAFLLLVSTVEQANNVLGRNGLDGQ
ncbi:helix-turn-helix transcriptional regulator [Lactococcus lactis]|nr:helix-turn-helix transcriptional regulator [Lactococcus lactis]MDT2969153.1 helix-turn-helix transcriptional regulator [Lactococcus lactis]